MRREFTRYILFRLEGRKNQTITDQKLRQGDEQQVEGSEEPEEMKHGFRRSVRASFRANA